jgi:hypothetical protein
MLGRLVNALVCPYYALEEHGAFTVAAKVTKSETEGTILRGSDLRALFLDKTMRIRFMSVSM